jgi:hypothetical protein
MQDRKDLPPAPVRRARRMFVLAICAERLAGTGLRRLRPGARRRLNLQQLPPRPGHGE